MTAVTDRTAVTGRTATTPHRSSRRAGTVLLALVVLFFAQDAVIHVWSPPQVVATFTDAGFPAAASRASGVVVLAFLVLLVARPTRVVGALLLTAYLGGVFASQLRVDAPLFSSLLFSVYVCVALWAGLLLRDPALRRVVLGR
ncbi:DoxX family protein [Kineococcus sp. SYSU DK006]|uniref:DoxX family protein n=1 Tax=Kineococcus sp. SYSU DK006 TaxID=3383127 RepID=UPI003D7D6655